MWRRYNVWSQVVFSVFMVYVFWGGAVILSIFMVYVYRGAGGAESGGGVLETTRDTSNKRKRG